MERDLELEAWQRDWREQAVVLPDLARRVARETRRMRMWLLAEVAVIVGAVGGSMTWAIIARRPDVTAFAVGVVILTGAATLASGWLRRGTWAPVASTTAAFLELSILRCRRRRDALVAQAVLYVLLMAFDLTWLYRHHLRYGSPGVLAYLTSPVISWVWPMTVGLAVVAVWYRRKLTRELAALTALERQSA